ncbi:hypothetical protein JR316_0001691 [Psilocybe cubensis]|uniref:Uncharacterized protein n=2 Tax=Psilocybe cubensis TaxID=181762 RepID=A0ACB8HC67_PSICU|nr:hypothetical protein JR316_0012522 [Psilocybe cubensis]XP_047752414.1 hypothetical protein JR316_0001691 [Psilocybe cubensis]KAH9475411.1 hypothetical protein JR316_0012522 [Psilocybe cubensis]KAH9484789.1 hypothetical protein JR316_0001691 [Psilocybe cubensis]
MAGLGGWIIDHSVDLKPDITHHEDLFTRARAHEMNAPRRVLCIVFATGGSIELMSIAPFNDRTSDVFDVGRLFPNGAISSRVTCIPGTAFRLGNHLRIIVSKNDRSGPVNKSVEKIYNIQWHGNIVVAQYDVNGIHPIDFNINQIESVVSIFSFINPNNNVKVDEKHGIYRT